MLDRLLSLWNSRRCRCALAAGIFFLCALLLLHILTEATIPAREPVALSVVCEIPVQDAAGKGSDAAEEQTAASILTAEDAVSYGGPFLLTAVLPKAGHRFLPLLKIEHLTEKATLSLNGAFLYRFSPSDAPEPQMITLPQNCGGKTLTLSLYKQPGTPPPHLLLSDSNAEDAILRTDANRCAFLTLAFGMAFLFPLGLFLFEMAAGAFPYRLLLLSAAALSQMLYYNAMNMPPSAVALFPGAALAFFRGLLFSIPSLYLLFSMKKWRKVFAPFAILPALCYFIAALGQFYSPALSAVTYRAGEVFYITIAALLICTCMEARCRNAVFLQLRLCLLSCAAALAAALLFSALTGGELLSYAEYLCTLLHRHRPDFPLSWWNVLLLIFCLSIEALGLLRRMAQMDAEPQMLSARQTLAQEQLAAAQESIDSLREMRHEVMNHLVVIQQLCCAGQTDRLTSYLARLIADAEAVPIMQYTAHPVANAVLSTMLSRARKLGIRTDVAAALPQTLSISDTDLCILMTNLLQNALEANEQPSKADKWLRIRLCVQGAHLFFSVENSRFSPLHYDSSTGLFRTTKADKTAHGYGLKAAKIVALKYESELVLEATENSFSAATALQIPE